MAKVQIALVHPDAKMPKKATKDSVGYDCVAVSRTITEKYVEYDLGFAVKPEEGYYVQIVSRSSVTKKHLFLKNCVGIIDPDYTDTIKVRFSTAEGIGVLADTGWIMARQYKDDSIEETFISVPTILPLEAIEEREYDIAKDTMVVVEMDVQVPTIDIYEVGDKVCQLIVTLKHDADFEEVSSLSATERSGGFGSTDVQI